jgi:hypothetical protein
MVRSLEGAAIRLFLPNKPRGIPRVDDRPEWQTAALANMTGYASGVFVMNGQRGIDSVTARLAGGEHITRTSRVNASTIGALQFINRTGTAPNKKSSGF